VAPDFDAAFACSTRGGSDDSVAIARFVGGADAASPRQEGPAVTIAVILAVLNGDAHDGVVLETALSLARRTDAHIRALHVRGDPAELAMLAAPDGVALAQELIAIAEQDVAERLLQAKQSFGTWRRRHDLPLAAAPANKKGVSAEWIEESGRAGDVLARLGQVADLVLLAADPRGRGDQALASFETALFRSGRPVLLVPKAPPVDLAARPMIAWKATPEAARAVAAALPLLKDAAAIDIFAADDSKIAPQAPETLLSYLAWHGLAATASGFDAGAPSVGEALLAAAKRSGATLLVLGGYGHSRLRELVFGGVTQHVIAHADIPVLLAH
jgi:nucleotide-binding universal stress UspA family protein